MQLERQIADVLGFKQAPTQAECQAAIDRQALPELEWQDHEYPDCDLGNGCFYLAYKDAECGRVLFVIQPDNVIHACLG